MEPFWVLFDRGVDVSQAANQHFHQNMLHVLGLRHDLASPNNCHGGRVHIASQTTQSARTLPEPTCHCGSGPPPSFFVLATEELHLANNYACICIYTRFSLPIDNQGSSGLLANE